jgi:glycosyltransferase involved in cell wall biosynthesis
MLDRSHMAKMLRTSKNRVLARLALFLGRPKWSWRNRAVVGRPLSEIRTFPKILFIAHDDFRAGASIVLLQFLRWLKNNTDIPFEILIKVVYGDLISEFRALAPVIAWSQASGEEPQPREIEATVAHLRRQKVALIYSNTFTNGRVLAALSKLNCPVISHVHELEFWIKNRTEPGNNKEVIKHTHHYIAVSDAVKECLITDLKIPSDRISLIYEFVSTEHDVVNRPLGEDKVRQELHLPDGALIVGGCGTIDWRKGVDLFVPLAKAVQNQLGRSVHFVWLGGVVGSSLHFVGLEHDVRHSGLDDCVHFVGVKPNPRDYFAIFDLLVLLSREDPFPLVVLEAASMGKPTVCFDRSGGAKEFIADDCGFVVPYLDIHAMASKVVDLLRSVELRHRLGRNALHKVRAQCDVRVAGPQLMRVIEKFV